MSMGSEWDERLRDALLEAARLDGEARIQAHELCLVLCRYLLLEREQWDTMEDAVQAIGAVTQIYLDCLE